MNNTLVPAWREREQTWLRLPRLRTSILPVPAWTAQIFPAQPQPVAAATCGDDHGYLVLQWPDDTDLTPLQPALGTLSAHTGRALICTCAQPEQAEGAVQQRYFAPQYGVDEDAATGSAVRVLADYFSGRFAVLTAQQCSPAGGLLQTRLAPAHVEVGGRCQGAALRALNV